MYSPLSTVHPMLWVWILTCVYLCYCGMCCCAVWEEMLTESQRVSCRAWWPWAAVPQRHVRLERSLDEAFSIDLDP